jgi:hypothetical protein
MTRDEVLLFKQFDSDSKALCRHTFHSAFMTQNIEELNARESCEVRCIAFFPSHTPNTIPEIPEEDLIDRYAHRLMSNLTYLNHLKEEHRVWFYTNLY